MSSKVESTITGKSTSSFTFIAELVRGMRFNVRNIWKELLFTVLCLILGFIPVINLTLPFILFVIQSYYLDMGIMDYYMERHFTIGAALAYIDQHKLFVTGIGGCFILTMLIPVIGWVFAPI